MKKTAQLLDLQMVQSDQSGLGCRLKIFFNRRAEGTGGL
jgi:hypothetical protein